MFGIQPTMALPLLLPLLALFGVSWLLVF